MAGRMELLAENTRFQVCLGIIVFITILGIIGPYFTYDPAYGPMEWEGCEPPSWEHKLGTNKSLQDVWARVIHGTRNSLMVGATAGLIGIVLAFVIGGIGPYKGGLTDESCTLLANVFLVIPWIPVLMVLTMMLKERSYFMVAVVIGFMSWAWGSRTIRSQVLSLKERGFVNLARISGKGDTRIFLSEITPNMLAYIFTTYISIFTAAILAEAGISMLGLGPTKGVTLGIMLRWVLMDNAVWVGAWWWFVPPGLIILLLAGSAFMLISVMDDVLNPRLRGALEQP